MSIEDLMKPRYKVIADYPNSNFKLGDIKQCAEKFVGDINFFNKYPHLFKKLEWWEERAISDMPDYILFVDDYMEFFKGSIYKVEDWSNQLERGMIPFRFTDEEYGLRAVPPSFNQLLPATEQDYNNYVNKTK